jgi:hypothetical protein
MKLIFEDNGFCFSISNCYAMEEKGFGKHAKVGIGIGITLDKFQEIMVLERFGLGSDHRPKSY